MGSLEVLESYTKEQIECFGDNFRNSAPNLCKEWRHLSEPSIFQLHFKAKKTSGSGSQKTYLDKINEGFDKALQKKRMNLDFQREP